MWQFLFTLFVSLVRGKRILVGHHNIGVILQYSHILQTQTRFIIQLSTPYRVTLCHTMSHCHCTGWKQPQLTAFWTVWHHFYSLRAETVVRGREGGMDTMSARLPAVVIVKEREMAKTDACDNWNWRDMSRRESIWYVHVAASIYRQTVREIVSARHVVVSCQRVDSCWQNYRERLQTKDRDLCNMPYQFLGSSLHIVFMRFSVQELIALYEF